MFKGTPYIRFLLEPTAMFEPEIEMNHPPEITKPCASSSARPCKRAVLTTDAITTIINQRRGGDAFDRRVTAANSHSLIVEFQIVQIFDSTQFQEKGAAAMSSAEEVEAPLPPTSDVIMPAKSEDKLEIEREEKERGNEDGKDAADGADEKKDDEVSNALFVSDFFHPTTIP